MKVKSLGNIAKDKEFNAKENKLKISDTVREMTGGMQKNISLSNIAEKLKWSLICDRYTNDFDYNPEQDKKLADEIEEFGLQHAIIVVKIENYLKLENIPDKAKEYYEKALADGFVYYILSGHRRSRAIMSLCYGKQVGLDKKEFYEFYSKKYKDLFWQDAVKENKWSVVNVQEYKPTSAEEEERLTQVENFSNRIIQTFTWVYNAYKLMSEKEKVTAEDVTKFVNEQHGVDLSSKHIGNYLTVIKTIDDERFISAIFNGTITPQDAKCLAPYYKKKLTSNNELKEKVLKELHNGQVDVKSYIEKLTNKKSKKQKEIKKEKLTKKVVLDLFDKFINGTITKEQFEETISTKY